MTAKENMVNDYLKKKETGYCGGLHNQLGSDHNISQNGEFC